MPFAASGPLQICYETFGDAQDPPLLLISGLGSQLLFWHEEFCNSLVDRGFFVIRFDNRDSGLSTVLPDGASYTLSDMAVDAISVLDDLSLPAAHLVGQSLGGMIAQTIAIEHPDRVLTLTSISANTGNFDYGKPTDDALRAITAPAAETRDEQIERDVLNRRIWASPSYFDEDDARAYYTAGYDRSYTPAGGARQFEAMLASGSREDGLAALRLPVLVVHGALDPLIGADAANRMVSLVPDAELLLIDGMAHDLPVQVWQIVIQAITAMAARAAA